MSRLRDLIIEVHRRSLWQVLAIYAVGSWGVYQVVIGVVQGVGLPEWVPAFTLVLFLVGLPIVLATAFVQERGPSATDLRGMPARRELDPTLFPGEDSVPAAEAVPSPALHRMLTWRRSLGAGLAAFALLALGTTGFMAMRQTAVPWIGTLFAQGVLEEKDRILLADFTGAGTLADVVTDALRIDLMQSAAVRVADPTYVKAVLLLMERDPAAGLPTEAAVDLARREGLKAVLVGEVAQLPGSYMLTAQLVHAETGAILAAFKAPARDSTKLIDAIHDLSKQVRAKIGESLRTVNSTPPLWRVSTASLPALRKYSEAMRMQIEQGDDSRTIALIEEAIALDSTFAMAYRKLGITLNNLGIRRADGSRALTKAYELRDRLSERERLLTVATYHSTQTGDVAAAIDAYRAALALDPDDYVAGNNLPILLWREGRLEEAEELLRRAAQSPTAGSFHFTNLVQLQYAVGRTEDAVATQAEARRRMPDNSAIARMETRLLYVAGDLHAADTSAQGRAQRFRSNRTGYVQALFDIIDLAQLRGQLRQVDRLTDELRQIAQESNLAPQVLMSQVRPIAARMPLREPAETAARLHDLLRRVPLERLRPLDRPYLDFATMFAFLGDFAAADAMIRAYEENVPAEERLDEAPLRQIRSIVQLHRAPSQQAIADVVESDNGTCRICGLPMIGRAYETLGMPDSALAVYRRYVETPQLVRMAIDASELPFVLNRLGELYEQRGDAASAALHYNRLLTLWQNADAELQPRVQAVRNRLNALQRRG